MNEWHIGDWCWYQLSSERDPSDSRIRVTSEVRVEILRINTTRAKATIRLLDYPRMRARSVALYRLRP